MCSTSSRSTEFLISVITLAALGSSNGDAHADTPAPRLEVDPTLLVELDARMYASESEGLTGFTLGRMRPGLRVVAADWVSAETSVEFAGEHATLFDAFVTLRPDPSLRLDIGLSKTPLFYSHREPVHTLTFPAATLVALNMRVQRETGRDLGVGLQWAPAELPLEVLARVGNGSASFLSNDNMELAYYLGLDFVLGRSHRLGSGEHGLRLGLAGVYEHAEDRNGIAASHTLGFIYRRAPVVTGDRFVLSGHLLALLGPLTLLVETGYAVEDRARDDDGNPNTPRVPLEDYTSYGLSAELGWSFCGRREPSRARTPGVVDLGLRFERLWVGDGLSDLDEGGGTSVTLVAKWWPTTYMAVSALATVVGYDLPAIEDPSRDTSWGAMLRLSFFRR